MEMDMSTWVSIIIRSYAMLQLFDKNVSSFIK